MDKQIGRLFMKKTTYDFMEDSDQEKGLKQPPVEKRCNHGKLIELPSPNELEVKDVNLKNLIEQRKSLRKYNQKPLSLKELSYLLWCTQGIKDVLPRDVSIEEATRTVRTVPSAGARHAFETLILVNNVEGLKKGLYRYVASEHKLGEVYLEEGIDEKINEGCLGQVFVKTSAVTFIWTAEMYRMTYRYGERGYRYIHLDAGHVCQNLYLASEAIDCGVCAIAAFDDFKLNEILGLDGESEFVVYIGTCGKK